MTKQTQFGLFDAKPEHSGLTAKGDTGQVDMPPISHIRGYLSDKQQQLLLAEACTYPFASPQIQVFGKLHSIPRQQVWFADEGCEYRYSGLLVSPEPWPHYALRLRQQLNQAAWQTGALFNGCLVNRYRGGQDAMGFHADDEPELIADALVAIVSLGEDRPLVMRRNCDGHRVRLLLQSGDLLLMHSPMQSQWQHAIPKSRRPLGERISFTFRAVIPGYHRRQLD